MQITDKIHSTLELRQIANEPIALPPALPETINKECRICLHNLEEQNNQFISPCECHGSMKYVHEKCLKQWLQIKAVRDIESIDLDEGGVECELCKRKIKVQLQIRRQWHTCSNVKDIITNKLILFLVCIFGVAFSFGLIIYTSLQLGTQIRNGYGSAPIVERIVVIASIILNFLLLVFFLYNMSQFFTYSKAEIKFGSR